MNRTAALLIALSVLARGACAETPWADENDGAAVAAEMAEFFKDAEVRTVGSPGNVKIQERVAEKFKASGFETGEIVFDAPSFIPGKTTITPQGLGEITVHPLHPSI